MQDTPESTINSISEFLHAAGTQFRIVDMGRGYRELSAQTFVDIEYQKQPVPFPRQQHMWFGCIFWQSGQHFIWFIKLPLDERGLLNQAARNSFLEKVIQALGAQLQNTVQQNGQLGDNPFTFTPNQKQLADFHAFAKKILIQPASPYLAPCIDYIQSPSTKDWQTLPVQGLAEIASRCNEGNIQVHLLNNWSVMPRAVTISLLESFEHYAINKPLAVHIKKEIEVLVKSNQIDFGLLASYLRALSQADIAIQTETVRFICSQADVPSELLLVIAARNFAALQDTAVLHRFIPHLLSYDDDFVMGLYQDLVQLPQTRMHLLSLIHDTRDTTGLSQRIKQITTAS
jgi:hypothetical protein